LTAASSGAKSRLFWSAYAGSHHETFEHRGLGLLELREERVAAVSGPEAALPPFARASTVEIDRGPTEAKGKEWRR